jgi:enoyl-CoA hydratase
MDVDAEGIRYRKDPPNAYVVFNRPDKLNALTQAMGRDATRAIRDADRDEKIRAIIVTGGGDAFCAGADLNENISSRTGEAPDVSPGEDDLTFRHEFIGTPIIASVNGVCVGGAMEFLQATDIRIAAESARFGQPEPRWGIAPMAGTAVRLPRQIPFCRAMEFLLTGNIFPAEYALDAGLVNEVVPDGEAVARAEEIAADIAKNSPFAVRKLKEMVYLCQGRLPEDAFRLEKEIAAEIFASEDAQEGPEAFAEDRSPSYRID